MKEFPYSEYRLPIFPSLSAPECPSLHSKELMKV